MSQPYQITDKLYLWYLGRPARPVLVGALHLVMSGRGVALRYAPEWLQQGFALSDDLPLIDIEHLPRDKDCAAGAVDDARPDRWGERVIRLLERPARLSVLEMLYFAGDGRFGALGVSTSGAAYAPAPASPLPQLADVNAMHTLVRQVIAGERIDETRRRLIAPGATMGGARPKALIQMDGAEWVLKFAEEAHASEPLVEHAAMTLAAKAAITVAETRPIKLARGVAVAVKRFDRAGSSKGASKQPGKTAGNDRNLAMRRHAISVNVALKAAGADLSYPALAQLLRRRGVVHVDANRKQIRELFRRLVFNILIDNTDDHEKNHVLLVDDAENLVLAPAFDVLPTGQALGYQSIGVGQDGAASEIDNALSMAAAYLLTKSQAIKEVKRVVKAVNAWRAHFKQAGVDARSIDSLSQQIDRPALLDQRRMFGK